MIAGAMWRKIEEVSMNCTESRSWEGSYIYPRPRMGLFGVNRKPENLVRKTLYVTKS